MTNYIKISMKPNHGSNYSYKHSNLSINDINLSFMNSISSPIDQMKDFTAANITLGFLFSDVTPVITRFLTNCSKMITPFLEIPAFAIHRLNANSFIINSFTIDYKKRYYGDLSKLVSGRASRNLLAFFVPDNSSASQAVTIYSSIAPRAYLSALRGQTIIYMANHLPTDYDGLTLQNKIVFGRICGAVSNKTESKTRHPIPLLYSVTLTQNLLGAIRHG